MKKQLVLYIGIGILATAGIATGLYLWLSRNKTDSEEAPPEESTPTEEPSDETEEPSPTRLVFIHHSCGENWLSDDNGGLGKALMDEGYFVSDTNYGWGPDGIGDNTDIGHWWTWFRGPNSSTYLSELYAESDQNSDYTRLDEEPEGENEIIMFKSCFPNSNLGGSIDNPVPAIENNQLKGESSDSEYHTVENAKGIYIDLLEYFMTQPDKIFIAVTAPPRGQNSTTSQEAENAGDFNNWLAHDWLDNYEEDNVYVFDFFDILTKNGASNYLEYADDPYDDHPSATGNQAATEEFNSFINEL